jgi:hypothetical protein
MENEILRDENNKLKQITRTMVCPSCTGEPQLQISQEIERLTVENQWLKQEVHHMTVNLVLL